MTLTPQMISFPKFIRKKEQSPRGLDGAFPPFKIEHRYKSVYERAGFDVNKGGDNNRSVSDSKSISSRDHTNHNNNNNTFATRASTRSRTRSQESSSSPVLQKNRTPSMPSTTTNTNMRNDSPTGSSNSSKTSSVSSSFTNSKSSSSSSTFRNTDEFSPIFEQPLTTGSSTTSFFNPNEINDKQNFQLEKNSSSSSSPPVIMRDDKNTTNNNEQTHDQFDFSPSSTHSRNQKNLKLDLHNDNIADMQSLPGISKVQSQQNTITNHSLHSTGSSASDKTHKQVEQPNINEPNPTNEGNDRQPQQAFEAAPPVQPVAPMAKFDPRKQRSIRGPSTNQQNQQGQQQRVPYSNADSSTIPERDPYSSKDQIVVSPTFGIPNPQQQPTRNMSPTGLNNQIRNGSPTGVNPQTRNMSPTTGIHNPPSHPYHQNNSRPSSPKLGAHGTCVPQLPMMSLNSPTSAYRPYQRPQSPGLPSQNHQNVQPHQNPYNPFNHHQHQQQPPKQPPQQPSKQPQQVPGGFYYQPQPQPPRSRQQATYSQIRDDKLSSALNDFKQDLETHKSGGIKSPVDSNNSNNSMEDEIPSSASPSELGLTKYESKEDSSQDNEISRFSYGNSMGINGKEFDPSTQFENFSNQQIAKDGNLNNEYAEFLASQNDPVYENNKGEQIRNNHLSMVSSILTKASGNSEDDEIERELQRQLDSLKMSGSSIDISKIESRKSRNSFGISNINNSNNININGGIPLFNIQDVDEVDEELEEQEEQVTKPLSISAHTSTIEKDTSVIEPEQEQEQEQEQDEEEEDDYDDEYTRPLTIHSSNEEQHEREIKPDVQQLKFQEQQKQVQFQVPYPQDNSFNQDQEEENGNETIDADEEEEEEEEEEVKPLSPKTHSIEQELQNMNFYIPETTESPSVYIFPATNKSEEKDELPQERNIVSPPQPIYPVHDNIVEEQHQEPQLPQQQQISQQPVYPTEEIHVDEPEHHSHHHHHHHHHHEEQQPQQPQQQESPMYPSGQGPCRTCQQTIDVNAKGKLKPIYSKTGELSGQWHRQCFICTSPECSIQFSKHVQCYVFNDEPYCFEHYHILNNSVCKSCQVGIEGRCISNELDEKWHLNCLNCSKCSNGIRDDYFIVNGNSIVCQNCKDNGGLSVSDRIEKRRTRIYNV